MLLGQRFENPEELKQFVLKSTEDGKYYCSICNEYSHISISNARNHVESKHFPGFFTYNCEICFENFNNRQKLYLHKSKHKS